MSDHMAYSPQTMDPEQWIDMNVDCAPAAAASADAAKSPDEWKHIADSTQRKKVQNRNAQRIYRKPGQETDRGASILKRRRSQAQAANRRAGANQQQAGVTSGHVQPHASAGARPDSAPPRPPLPELFIALLVRTSQHAL